MILLNTNCWKLQFLPSLGENDMVSASCYYTCAYYSRHTLKKLDVSLGMLSSQDIKSLIQFTPKIQELTVRFSANRVFQPTKKEYVTYSRIKKLWLYNFTPKHNLELSTLVKNFPALENLFIFGERDKAWLGNIDDPLTIDNFFYCINSIHKYEIMTPGGTQAIELSKPWLQSIKNSKQDVHLLHTYKEINNPNHIKFESNVVATFYGGSIQSAPLLKWVIMVGQSDQEKIDRLSFLDDQIISCLRVEGVTDLQPSLKLLIAKEQTRLKQIVFFDCVLDGYTPRINAAPVSQHIKCIIFRDCKIDFLTLKSFLKEFESLDYIEFDNCTFSGNTEMKSIDISDTNIKIMKMINFRKMLDGHTYTDTVQNIITISVYFATQNLTRYFSVVENNVLETTRLTYQMFSERFNSNEAVVLNIKVKSMRELSLMLTKTSKVFVLSFD
ncbi:hypothetical protein HPULCUR_008352 [Helicostylum pulchrum]|uniref:F-box domain-containing protein n=1 Tax=Helicostylum pulchrum TaxID=562976 RepID=A0ABP9Y7C7_9FUNG